MGHANSHQSPFDWLILLLLLKPLGNYGAFLLGLERPVPPFPRKPTRMFVRRLLCRLAAVDDLS